MAVKTNYIKNGISYYRVTASVGRNSNGKLIRKEFYGKNKTEAENLKNEYLDNIKNGLNIDYKNVILGDLMHSWLFDVVHVSNKIKPSTFERYEGIYRIYILDSEIYGLKVNEIKPINLQHYYNKLYIEENKSSNIIFNLNKLLKSFFFYAVDEGYILRNPCSNKRIVIPGKEEKGEPKVEIFSDNEILLLEKALKGHRLRCLILLALYTGLRQGELLGLKWSDISKDFSELKVQRNVKQVYIITNDDHREFKTIEQIPKTKNSIRTVPIPSFLTPILKNHKTEQNIEKLKAGDLYTESDYVFTTALGKIIDAKNLTKSYKRILKKAGIPYKKFHSLRHTYATKLFERNVDLKTVSELLGHSNISTTANIYVHVMPHRKILAAEKLNDLFI